MSMCNGLKQSVPGASMSCMLDFSMQCLSMQGIVPYVANAVLHEMK